MFIDPLSEWFVSLGLDLFKNRLKEQRDEHKLYKRLEEFFAQYKSQFENISHDSEFDLEGVINCFRNQLNSDIKQCLYGTTFDERERAKQSIHSKVISFAHAVTPEAQSQVKSLVDNVLHILYEFHMDSVNTDLLLAVNTITSELSPIIDSMSRDVGQVQSAVEQLVVSGLTESDIQSAHNGDNSHVALKVETMQQAISALHPVKGYHNQIIEGKIFSVPVSPDAQQNPPKITVTGQAMLGDKPVCEITDETLDYAYRHQLSFKISVKDAIKYLGEIVDPNQEEAKSLIGGTIIAQPQSFPPAFPVSLYCGDECVFDYVLIRMQEILDDGTFIITNSEQTNSYYRFILKMNIKTNHADISVTPKDNATTRELLTLHCFYLKARTGNKLRLKLLKEQATFLEFCNTPIDDDNDIAKRKFFIETLENLIVLEEYYNTQFNLPEPVEINDCRWIIFIGKLIKGQRISVPWEQFVLSFTVSESTKDRMTKGANDLTYIGSVSIKMWSPELTLPVAITYKKAKLKDEDRILNIIQQMKVGETLSLTYISEDEKGEAVYQLYDSSQVPHVQ